MGNYQDINACRFLTLSTLENSRTLIIIGRKYVLYNVNICIYVLKIMEKYKIFKNYLYLKYICIKIKV